MIRGKGVTYRGWSLIEGVRGSLNEGNQGWVGGGHLYRVIRGGGGVTYRG